MCDIHGIPWNSNQYVSNNYQRLFSILLEKTDLFYQVAKFGDSSGIRTHNKLSKWLSYLVSTYLCGAFDCMLLSCHVWKIHPETHTWHDNNIQSIKFGVFIGNVPSAKYLKKLSISNISHYKWKLLHGMMTCLWSKMLITVLCFRYNGFKSFCN